MVVNNIHFTEIEIQIVKYLFKHFKEKFNARQLARLLSKNHVHVNKLCKLLVKKQLLDKEDLGNSVYYFFNFEKSSVNFVNYLLKFENYPKNLQSLLYKLNSFKELVHFGLIFGSAINSLEYHDVDVLLVYDKNNQKQIRKLKTHIRKSKLIEKPIRYLELTPKDLDFENPVIYSSISDSLLIFGATKFSKVISNVANNKSVKMVFK